MTVVQCLFFQVVFSFVIHLTPHSPWTHLPVPDFSPPPYIPPLILSPCIHIHILVTDFWLLCPPINMRPFKAKVAHVWFFYDGKMDDCSLVWWMQRNTEAVAQINYHNVGIVTVTWCHSLMGRANGLLKIHVWTLRAMLQNCCFVSVRLQWGLQRWHRRQAPSTGHWQKMGEWAEWEYNKIGQWGGSISSSKEGIVKR